MYNYFSWTKQPLTILLVFITLLPVHIATWNLVEFAKDSTNITECLLTKFGWTLENRSKRHPLWFTFKLLHEYSHFLLRSSIYLLFSNWFTHCLPYVTDLTVHRTLIHFRACHYLYTVVVIFAMVILSTKRWKTPMLSVGKSCLC